MYSSARDTSVNSNRRAPRVCRVFLSVFFLCVWAFLIAPECAQAYIDPGSGGLVYQVLILVLGLIGGYFAFLKKFIKSFFASKRSKTTDDPEK